MTIEENCPVYAPAAVDADQVLVIEAESFDAAAMSHAYTTDLVRRLTAALGATVEQRKVDSSAAIAEWRIVYGDDGTTKWSPSRSAAEQRASADHGDAVQSRLRFPERFTDWENVSSSDADDRERNTAGGGGNA